MSHTSYQFLSASSCSLSLHPFLLILTSVSAVSIVDYDTHNAAYTTSICISKDDAKVLLPAKISYTVARKIVVGDTARAKRGINELSYLIYFLTYVEALTAKESRFIEALELSDGPEWLLAALRGKMKLETRLPQDVRRNSNDNLRLGP